MSIKQEIDNYRLQNLHFPRLADRAAAHINLYKDCECNFFLPFGNTSWGNVDTSCSNCRCFFHFDSITLEDRLKQNVFIYEYASALLNVTPEQSINLCNCCLATFYEEFSTEG